MDSRGRRPSLSLHVWQHTRPRPRAQGLCRERAFQHINTFPACAPPGADSADRKPRAVRFSPTAQSRGSDPRGPAGESVLFLGAHMHTHDTLTTSVESCEMQRHPQSCNSSLAKGGHLPPAAPSGIHGFLEQRGRGGHADQRRRAPPAPTPRVGGPFRLQTGPGSRRGCSTGAWERRLHHLCHSPAM